LSIVLKDDSDGTTRQIWAQEQNATCAIASIWMARSQAKQMTFAESEWHLAWTLYERVVRGLPETPAPPGVSFNPGSYGNDQNSFGDMFANFGTYMSQVQQQLINDGFTVTPGSRTIDTTKLSETSPAIVLLGWYNNANQRVGGHFIVAAGVLKSGKIIYLDPWGGQLNESGVGPNYQTTGRFEQIIYVTAPP
jgi:hypothetical protein